MLVGAVGDLVEGAAQYEEDRQAWQQFLDGVRPNAILELGTGTGVFSRWLAQHVAWFATIDIEQPQAGTPGFHRLSVWDDESEILALITEAPRPFVLFCDDGDKPLEIDKYAPAVRVGDFVVVHDVGTEVFLDRDIPRWLTVVQAGGLTAFCLKTAHPPLRDRVNRRVRLLRGRLRIRTRLLRALGVHGPSRGA
jgi:hypothetical protein